MNKVWAEKRLKSRRHERGCPKEAQKVRGGCGKPKTSVLPVIWLCSLCLWAVPSLLHAAFRVPLTVKNESSVRRILEPVTTGVPLPQEAAVKDVSLLSVTDTQGTPVPAQFTVLSRWHGTPDDSSKPIKWVLVDFQAHVEPDETAVYYLERLEDPSSAQTPLSISEDAEKILVDTGAARFQISKNYFNLFDYVWVPQGSQSSSYRLVLASKGMGGIVLTDGSGREYRTLFEPPEELAVERVGPMTAVVRVRGVFKSADNAYFAPSTCRTQEYPKFCQPYPKSYFYYECRMVFYKGKDYVRVSLTLENNGANGSTNPERYYAPNQSVLFDSVYMVIQPFLGSPSRVATEEETAYLQQNDLLQIRQDWHENLTDSYPDTLEPRFAAGPFFQLAKNGQMIREGQRHSGWVEWTDERSQFTVALRHFWQNFPKSLVLGEGSLKIGLWPEGGYYPYTKEARREGLYLFDAGRHKTYEMLLSFSPFAVEGEGKKISNMLEHPLMALAPAEWFAETRALGMMAPAGFHVQDPVMDEAIQRFERLQRAMVLEEDSDNRWTIFNIKTQDPAHWEFTLQNRFFNWMNFGDLLWSGQSPCNLHYDWTYAMLLHYIRTGRSEFLQAGRQMAKYRYDVGQYHGERTDDNGNHKWLNHFQFYESSGHADPNLAYYPSRVAGPSHTWNGGLLLYYLLTGDPRAAQAAQENGLAALNYFGEGGIKDAGKPGCPSDEIRAEGWSMLNLLNLYRVFGDEKYLQVAKNIAVNRLLYRESQVRPGCWGAEASSGGTQQQIQPFACAPGGCGSCANTQWNTMYAYVTEALVQVAAETQDASLNSLLIRMADFMRTQFLFGADFNGAGQYRPLQSLYLWVQEDPDGTVRNVRGEIVKNFFWPDVFAYVYHITGHKEYLDWARKSFKDAVFYYAQTGSQYLDPNVRSAVSFMDSQFPNSHTKVHGWIGRTNQVYLFTEWRLSEARGF